MTDPSPPALTPASVPAAPASEGTPAPIEVAPRRRRRPPKRGVWLKVRMTPSERDRWHARAAAGGVTASEAVRLALAGVRPVQRSEGPRPVDPALVRQLAAIGGLLNQLARWANAYHRGAAAMEVCADLVRIERELASIRAAVEAADARSAKGEPC